MVAALRLELGNTLAWTDPRGGFFLWVALPKTIDSDRMIERAVEHRVVYVAGSAFFVNEGPGNMMRLSFSAPTHEQIREGVRRLAATIREELTVEPRAGDRSAPASTAR
jgi:2-aminoadipate transaminase